jgi:hypothetical protein
MKDDTIFISIASCKEEFLVQTIRSAIENSDNPDLLYFGIANTVIDDKDFLSDPIFEDPRINYMDIKHEKPLGTGIGRLMSSVMNHRDHQYLLQIDAHNIFEKSWDTILKNYYNDLLKICDKPIISTNPLRWIDGPNKEVFLYNENGLIVNPYNFKTEENFSSLGIKVISVRDHYHTEGMTDYAYVDGNEHKWDDGGSNVVEHGLIHAAFMFTDFSFTRELMHDPSNPFNGDQINISFRAGTRGYRMFSIKKCIVWSKVKFTSNGTLLSQNDWRAFERGRIGVYNEKKSAYHQAQIFSGEYLGYWGAPTKESIAEYYDRIGVDLSKFFNSKDDYLT